MPPKKNLSRGCLSNWCDADVDADADISKTICRPPPYGGGGGRHNEVAFYCKVDYMFPVKRHFPLKWSCKEDYYKSFLHGLFSSARHMKFYFSECISIIKENYCLHTISTLAIQIKHATSLQKLSAAEPIPARMEGPVVISLQSSAAKIIHVTVTGIILVTIVKKVNADGTASCRNKLNAL